MDTFVLLNGCKAKDKVKGCMFQRLRDVCDVLTASLSTVSSEWVQWPVKIRAIVSISDPVSKHEHISNHDERKKGCLSSQRSVMRTIGTE